MDTSFKHLIVTQDKPFLNKQVKHWIQNSFDSIPLSLFYDTLDDLCYLIYIFIKNVNML